jgi:hypothetical protein
MKKNHAITPWIAYNGLFLMSQLIFSINQMYCSCTTFVVYYPFNLSISQPKNTKLGNENLSTAVYFCSPELLYQIENEMSCLFKLCGVLSLQIRQYSNENMWNVIEIVHRPLILPSELNFFGRNQVYWPFRTFAPYCLFKKLSIFNKNQRK